MEWLPDRIIGVEWDSKVAVQAFVSSPEYQAVAPLRLHSTTTRPMVASGYRKPQQRACVRTMWPDRRSTEGGRSLYPLINHVCR